MTWSVSIKLDSLELRSCTMALLTEGMHETLEIVKWDNCGHGDFCYTLAHWQRDEEGDFYLRFVGDRPMDTRISEHDLNILIRMGYEFLTRVTILIGD
jgi:hypothetical protein